MNFKKEDNMFSNVWNKIVSHEGQVFTQIRGKEFTYRIVGNSIIPSTTNRNIHMNQFEKAYELMPLKNTSTIQNLQGPSYLFAILTDNRIKD